MHIMKDDERLQRWTEPRWRQATDLTDRDVIFWEGQWTEVLGVYRDMDEWELHFGATPGQLIPPSADAWTEDRQFAEDALDWSSGMYVVLRLLDRENSNPGEIADKFVKVYQYEPVKTQSQPTWQPSAADQAPRTVNAASIYSLARLISKWRQDAREYESDGLKGDARVAAHLGQCADDLAAATRGRADRDDMDAFTEGLLEQVAQPGNERADARLARLGDAISDVTGTDGDTAAWLAARMIGTLEAMRVESGAYRVPGEGEPWNVAAWLASLAREV